MQESPYEPPQSKLQSDDLIEVPSEILYKIRNGWIAAVFSAGLTIVLVILSFNSDTVSQLVDLWSLIDVVLVLALAFGIYKKSRIASTTMLLYFLLSKAYVYSITGTTQGMITAIAFTIFYFQAMLGTYRYHQYIRRCRSVAEPTS